MSLSNIKDKIRELTAYIRKMTKPHSIQMTISISFTILSICSMAFLGVTLYRQFSNRAEAMTIESTGQLLNQTAINLEDYLRNMRRISDTMYYSVIKNKDLASDTMDEEMNLLYEANKDNLISIACYTGEGQLVAAVPVANEKSQVNIVKQQWFTDAVGQMENLHFSTPHVQNLFGDPSYRYYWVVSLSRAVELTSNGTSTLGVLLVDMNYNSIEQILKKANVGNSSEYVFPKTDEKRRTACRRVRSAVCRAAVLPAEAGPVPAGFGPDVPGPLGRRSPDRADAIRSARGVRPLRRFRTDEYRPDRGAERA